MNAIDETAVAQCPFCRGPRQEAPHSPLECAMHYRQRLREMTERRDALQVALDNQRRLVAVKAQRIQQITRERDEARRAARKAEAATERERAVIRRIARLAGADEMIKNEERILAVTGGADDSAEVHEEDAA